MVLVILGIFLNSMYLQFIFNKNGQPKLSKSMTGNQPEGEQPLSQGTFARKNIVGVDIASGINLAV